jgi:hypothetical protein
MIPRGGRVRSVSVRFCRPVHYWYECVTAKVMQEYGLGRLLGRPRMMPYGGGNWESTLYVHMYVGLCLCV